MKQQARLITRFEYIEGLKCRKLLWSLYNRSKSIPRDYDGMKKLHNVEESVTKLARFLFPDIVITSQEDSDNEPQEIPWSLVNERLPIFRANIKLEGIAAKIDILNPVADGKWDIFQMGIEEVDSIDVLMAKIAAYPKIKGYGIGYERLIQDVAFQCHCCEKAGIPIRNCYLATIDEHYIRRGDLNADELLILDDITEEVRIKMVGIESRIFKMQRVIEMMDCPAFEMFTEETNCLGRSHLTYRHCPLIAECREGASGKSVPPRSIIDADYDVEKIRSFMGQIEYPLCIFHINHVMQALPIEGCSPYTSLPYALDVQIIENLDTDGMTYLWSWDGSGDPRPLMLEIFRKIMPKSGSIIRGWNCDLNDLRSMACEFPEPQLSLDDLSARMLELIVPFDRKVFGEFDFNLDLLLLAMFHDLQCGQPDQVATTAYAQLIEAIGQACDTESPLHNLRESETMMALRLLRKLKTFL